MKNVKIVSILFIILFIVQSNLLAQSAIESQKTRVLILGTSHLNQVKGFNKESVAPVLEALSNYNFDVIGIENMPTELLNDIASRNDSTYFDLLESRGNIRIEMALKYQTLLGISFVESQKNITEILRQDSLTNSERVELMRYYLATGDIVSSALQYSYINENFLIEEQLVDSKTIKTLQELLDYNDEISSLALKLAKRRGHNRLEYIDNLQDEPILLAHFPNFISEYVSNKTLLESVLDLPVFKTIDSLETSGVENNDLMPLYRFLNGKEYQQADFDAEWKIWFTTNFDSNSDLSRYALWEMRNLQIAANIMKTAAFYPNKRILIIIGASHKSFLEKYLSQSPNIKLLKFE